MRIPKKLKRIIKNKHQRWLLFGSSILILLLASLAIYRSVVTVKIDPQAYNPLLTTIANGESNGNYNAYYSNAGNQDIIFTQMTIEQVLQWQDQFVKDGNPSSAVGRYQIIQPTLKGLVRQLDIDKNARFDESMQDRMAITLMERRGSIDYVRGKISSDQFAANLSQEWAALPKIFGANPEASYYDGDGLNKSRISIDSVLSALQSLKK